MKDDEKFLKDLPVPPHLDAQVLAAASRFLVRRRKRRRAGWGFFAAAALLMIATALFFPAYQRQTVRAELAELADWSMLDQECFNLSSEMNVCFSNDGEFFL